MATAETPARIHPADSRFVIGGEQTLVSVGDAIGRIPTGEFPTPRQWWFHLAAAFLLVLVFFYAVAYLFIMGVGIWGINIPVAWGFAIINFVWWIGIGHAGTLISAILLLLHQKWRTSINRFSEAMTLFAVMMAGLFPLLHLGRPWFFYWLYPIPMNFGFWPQFRSPLVWDVFAVTTYFTISLVFWYVGLIPDFASLRDRAPTRRQRFIYGIFSLGWRGSAIHWRRWEKVYLILAGISTPLVLSVHTVVSFDFAVAILPGWHATIFPPFFVAGAIFSGFAMVIVLAIPMRRWFKLEDFITDRHLDLCGRVMLATGLLVCYGYFSELWMGWYSHSIYEQYVVKSRVGLFEYPYAWSYWVLIFCNFVCIQPLWSKRVRSSKFWLFVISIIVLIGMWFERFVIVITLYRDFLPSSWGRYAPTIWDWATFIGTLGFFYFLFLLFVRFIPMISISEMREMLPHKAGGRDGHGIVEGPPARRPRSPAGAPRGRPDGGPRTTAMANGVYGLMAEFGDPDSVIAAAQKARQAGYTRMDGYTPYPVPGLPEAIGFRYSEMAVVMLIGGLIGATAGYLMQYWTMGVDYPVNIGGRPYHSWPSYIPITFEMTVLTTGLTGLFGLIAVCGLPAYHHPVFNAPGFERATTDRFFLCIEADDPEFDLRRTRDFLAGLGALSVAEVPEEPPPEGD